MIVEQLHPGNSWTANRLPVALKHLDIEPYGIIHVGAHYGQEVPTYRQCGFASITLVEPDPDNCAIIRAAYPDVPLLQLACAADDGIATFQRNARDCGGGLAEDPDYPTLSTFTVETRPLSAIQGAANVATIDTQGTELDVLRTADLSRLDLVVIETQEVGRGSAANWVDVERYMAECDWVPAIQWRHEIAGPYATYADTLFVPARRALDAHH
jgi:FkbM family methyltransferase